MKFKFKSSLDLRVFLPQFCALDFYLQLFFDVLLDLKSHLKKYD